MSKDSKAFEAGFEAEKSRPAYNSPQPFRTLFACLSLNSTDRIRFIDFPESVVFAVQQAIRDIWPQGISKLRPYGQSVEIKLHGVPWYHDPNGNDEARRLVLGIFEKLYNLGWVLQVAASVTRDKDSFVFRKQDPVPPPCEWIVVSFDHSSKLKVLGAVPTELSGQIIETFRTQIDKHEATADRLKIKFKGIPWMPVGEDTVETRKILLSLIGILESCGFTSYAAVDVESGDEPQTDILICQRQQGWVPGAPIWHR